MIEPVAVLYQPIFPGATEGERKEFHTAVQQCAFDRVVQLNDAVIGHHADGEDAYVLEAAIPLQTLGLRVTDGMRLKMDWGILQAGPGGAEVLDHLWWSNKVPLPYDEAAEARLHPDLWGYARFTTKSRAELEGPRHATGTQILGGDEHTGKKKPDEVEDELEKGNVK